LERTFQILVFVFGSTFHGRISTFFKVLRRDLTKTKGEEDLKRMEYSLVKSAKHSTRTLSLVQNQVRFQKKKDLANKYISIQGEEVNLKKCTIFILFWW
jgi:hypothetical protein